MQMQMTIETYKGPKQIKEGEITNANNNFITF